MSILDTFYILFKSDSSDLKKGAEEVGNIINHISNLITGVFATTKFIGGINSALEYGQKLSLTNRLLHVNAQDLQAWSGAVELAGGSADAFQSSLQSLAHHLNTSGEVALKVLPRIASLFSRLNQTQALNYGKSLGLDENTILLLQKGRREVGAIIEKEKQRKLLTKENIELFEKYRYVTAQNTQAQRDFFNMLTIEALPILIAFKTGLTSIYEYLIGHSDLVKGGFLGVAGIALLSLIGNTERLIGLITKLKKITGVAVIAAVGEDIIQTYKGNPKAYGSSLIKRGIGGEIQESVKNLFNKLLPQFGSLITLKQRNPSFISALNALNGNIPTTQINNTYTIGDINLTTDATDGKTFATEFIDHLQGLRTQQAQSNNYFDDGIHA